MSESCYIKKTLWNVERSVIQFLCIDIYHVVFAPPKNSEVAMRLELEPGGLEENVQKPLNLYHRETFALLSCYSDVSKSFNADQPIGDLFAHGINS